MEGSGVPNYCLWSGVGLFLYTAFESYVNRRQIKSLEKSELPKNIEIIKDKWNVKEEEIKKANEYNAEKM